MSTSSITSIVSADGSIFSVSGLASGLNTSEIISELMSIAREPVVRLTDEETKVNAQQHELQSIQTSLRQLSLSASELASPALFETSQAVTSSDPAAIGASVGSGAGVGGYQVQVTQLANSAQRTFSFSSPDSEQTVTIDGQHFNLAAGETVAELADAINSDASATVYAAALDETTVVLSDRATGDTGADFIEVSDPGEALVERAGLARQGQNAEYTVDGTPGSASTNTVTDAIAGVTLKLQALTTTTGPVTIDVAAPAPSTSTIAAQVKSFVELYNSSVSAIQAQLTTKPPAKPQTETELGTGTLFGDSELSSLLGNMRQAIYTPIAGLPASLSSLADIGVSTGAPSGSGAYSQSSVEGHLTIETAKLEEAIETDPAGVEQMLEKWSESFQKIVDAEAEPGGVLETRIDGDSTQSSYIAAQITTMEEALNVRQKALQEQYAALEAAISKNKSEGEYLTSQDTSTSTS